MAHCKCKTNKGTRCKHPSNPDSTHGYCSQHDAKKKMSRSKKSAQKAKSRSRKSSKKSSKNAKSRSKKSAKKYRLAASFQDGLMSKLDEIKQVAVVKTEINNLIEEIPKFLAMDHEQRKKACAVVADRAKEHATISGLAFKKFYEHENIQDDEACRYHLEKVENKKEKKGEQRTYHKDFFHDGNQLQIMLMDDLVSWITRDDNIEDVKDDLLKLLDSYKDAMQFSGDPLWIKLMTDCLDGL